MNCKQFLEKPFQKHLPDSWIYNYLLTSVCGTPDYKKVFSCLSSQETKETCLGMVQGKRTLNRSFFKNECRCRPSLIKRYTKADTPPLTESVWRNFFSMWKTESMEANREILIPLIQHQQGFSSPVYSGHGLFLLVGNAFLLHSFPDVVVYDPFFDRDRQFDLDWFGKLINIPGSFYIFNMVYSEFLLRIDMNKESNPRAWRPVGDNFDDFRFVKRNNILHVRVHSHLGKLHRQYNLENKRFIVIPLTYIFNDGVGHLNLLVYNIPKNTWEHFDSNGFVPGWSDHVDEFLEEKIRTLVRDEEEPTGFLRMKKYIPIKEITFDRCFQVYDRHGKRADIDTGDYCATWSYWYLNIRLRNPNDSPAFIVAKIIEEIQCKKQRETYIEFIRSFAFIIGKMIEELKDTFFLYNLKRLFRYRDDYERQIQDIFDYYIKTYFDPLNSDACLQSSKTNTQQQRVRQQVPPNPQQQIRRQDTPRIQMTPLEIRRRIFHAVQQGNLEELKSVQKQNYGFTNQQSQQLLSAAVKLPPDFIKILLNLGARLDVSLFNKIRKIPDKNKDTEKFLIHLIYFRGRR